jgi:hypothetical protein
MKIRSFLTSVINKSKSAFVRFPVTLTWAVLGTAYSIWLIEVAENLDNDIVFKHMKILMTFILGLSWYTGTHLIVEYFKKKKNRDYRWLFFITSGLLLLYYILLPDTKDAFENIIVAYRYVVYLVAGHLFAIAAPVIFVPDNNAFWLYLKNQSIALIIALVFSVVFYVGISIALASLEFLFDFDIHGRTYFKFFAFSSGMVNTWVYLAYLPENPWEKAEIRYPEILEVFAKYILIPLLGLYFVIVYAYTLKIIFNWDLPRGGVSWMVTGFSVFGYIIYLIIYPEIKHSASALIRWFHPWFFIALLPMLMLLFVAIGKRISDYGLTENRFYVVLLGIWLTGITLYFLINRTKKIKYLFSTLIVMLFLSVLGPWNAFSLSIQSQSSKFKQLYENLKALNFTGQQDQVRSFLSTFQYLYERNAMEQIEKILGFNPVTKYGTDNSWELRFKLKKDLGITGTVENNKQQQKYFPYSPHERNDPIIVAGYDYFKNLYLVANKTPEDNIHYPNNRLLHFRVLLKKPNLLIFNDTVNNKSFEINLDNYVNTLTGKYIPGEQIPEEDRYVEAEINGNKIKIIFYYMDVYKKTNKPVVETADIGILIKENK